MYDASFPPSTRRYPLWGCEDFYWEDFEIGYRIRTIRRTISEGESMAFNTLVVDIHPYVSDEVFAERRRSVRRRLVAGAFVFSAGIGLVATNWLQAFSYGYDRLRFIKPVFIGDTIYTIRTNLAKEPKYEERGLTRASTKCSRERASSSLYCEHIQTVLYRDPKTARKAEERGTPADFALTQDHHAMTTALRGMAWDHPRARRSARGDLCCMVEVIRNSSALGCKAAQGLRGSSPRGAGLAVRPGTDRLSLCRRGRDIRSPRCSQRLG